MLGHLEMKVSADNIDSTVNGKMESIGVTCDRLKSFVRSLSGLNCELRAIILILRKYYDDKAI
jgi:hypothetical protein